MNIPGLIHVNILSADSSSSFQNFTMAMVKDTPLVDLDDFKDLQDQLDRVPDLVSPSVHNSLVVPLIAYGTLLAVIILVIACLLRRLQLLRRKSVKIETPLTYDDTAV